MDLTIQVPQHRREIQVRFSPNSASSGYATPIAMPLRPLAAYCSKDKIEIYALSLALIVFLSLEVLVRKVDTVYMSNYTTFLQIIVLLACTIVFFVLYFLRRWVSKIAPIPFPKSAYYYFIGIAFLDCISSMFVLLAAGYVSSNMAALLAQGVIPLTMIICVLLGRQFLVNHYIGAFIIFVTNTVSMVFSNRDNSDTVWSVVFFLSNVPAALSSVAKEYVLTNPLLNVDLPTLNAWVSLFQLLFALVLSPASFSLQKFRSTIVISHLPMNFYKGLTCFLLGINHDDNDQCEYARWVVWIHIAVLVVLNILVLRVIFYGSATSYFIASGVSIPVISMASTLPFIEGNSIHWYDGIITIVLLGGLSIYRYTPESANDELLEHNVNSISENLISTPQASTTASYYESDDDTERRGENKLVYSPHTLDYLSRLPAPVFKRQN